MRTTFIAGIAALLLGGSGWDMDWADPRQHVRREPCRCEAQEEDVRSRLFRGVRREGRTVRPDLRRKSLQIDEPMMSTCAHTLDISSHLPAR